MASFCGILSLTLSFLCAFLTVHSSSGQSSGAHYRGRYIGPITAQKHKVSGEVYAVDARTLHIRGFTYDGTGPDAFFWTGFTEHPSSQGVIIPNDRGTKEVLGAYNGQDVTISLPDGLTLRDIKWIAVWCRAYEVNFGDLYIPANLDFPQPHVVGSLVGQHGVSSGPIVVVDAQTILVPDFTYDGQAPDLHFWVGRGVPGPNGVRVPDETGTDAPLVKADKKTMVLSLPGDLTVFDIDYFGVWCRLYSIDFGHVRVTPGLNVPPSLRMLGVAPQSKLNCEVLHEDSAFEIRWSVVESGETIVFQLVGRIDNGKYMAVGLSGEDDRSVMVGGDAMIGWFDQSTGSGNVVDYHLGGKSVCQSHSGPTISAYSTSTSSCPDVRFKEGANNIRLLSAASVNGFTILTFQRKLKAMDGLDKRIRTNESQPIIWAIGSMTNDVAGYHDIRNGDDISLDFGRTPKWNCPEPQKEPEFAASTHPQTFTSTTASPTSSSSSLSPTSVEVQATRTPVQQKVVVKGEQETSTSDQEKGSPPSATVAATPVTLPTAWRIPPIPCHEPDDGVYYLHLGPSGRKDIFESVTGKKNPPPNVWYVNGLLMPEIYLVRNKNYTFVVQGGDNGFYITDSDIGDFQHSSDANQQLFAGVEFDSLGNAARPTAVGKLCRWVENGNQPAEGFASYAAYQRTLTLECGKGHSGVLHFTPDKNTPNLVYYQSFSRQNMGWKIHVLDHCGKYQSHPAPPHILPVDQNIEESHQGATYVRPNTVILNDMSQQHQIQFSTLKKLQQSPPVPHHHHQSVASSIQQPIQNAYIIDTSMAGSFPSLQQFDSRFIFKGNKPLEPQSQGSQHRPSIVTLGPGNSFTLPQTPGGGLFQISLDGVGGESSSLNGPRPPPSPQQPIFQQQTGGFQQMPESHFSRRTGPQQYQQHQQHQYQQSPSYPAINSNYNKYQAPPPLQYGDRMVDVVGGGGGYFGEGKPEYFSGGGGPTRSPPLMSVSGGGGGRYVENQPPPQIMYATTMNPQRRHGSLPFLTHDSSSSSDVVMRGPPNSQGLRVQTQNGPRRPPPPPSSSQMQMDFQPGGMMNHENVQFKYLDHPSSKIMQNDGRHSNNAPPIWVHTRNLPKRESGRLRDVSAIRKGILREGLRRVTRDFRDFNGNEKEEMESSSEKKQKQQEGRSQVGISDNNNQQANFSKNKEKKEETTLIVVEEGEGKNFAGEESGAVQPISIAHQEHNETERSFPNNNALQQQQLPILESFFEPMFRPSPPDKKSPNDSTIKLNQLKNQLVPDPFPPSLPLYNYQKQGGKRQNPRFPSSFSSQQPAPYQAGGMYRRRPIKLQLREFLRQPALIPQLLAEFRNLGQPVREFVKLSPSIESTQRESHLGPRQVHVHNNNHNGQNKGSFRPRNDQIAEQHQLQPTQQHSASMQTPDSFSILPTLDDAVGGHAFQNPVSNVSFILFDEGDVDEGRDDDDDGGEDENGINGRRDKDDKIIPERENTTATTTTTTTIKANNDNNREPDQQLSLTLLTDVWHTLQIINQQGISLQKPHHQHHPNQKQHHSNYIIHPKQNHGKLGQNPPKMIIKGQRNMIRQILTSSPFFQKHRRRGGMASNARGLFKDGEFHDDDDENDDGGFENEDAEQGKDFKESEEQTETTQLPNQ